jgi:toxin ParE1/3/4
MNSPVTQRPRARLDLLEQFVYFGEQDSVELGDRYLTAINATCLRLVEHPHSGVVYDSGIARLQGLRRVPVKGFEHYLVFYLPQQQAGIDVIRVLHGARDIDNVFARDEA